MRDSNGAGARIGYQQRHAVRSLDCEGGSWIVTDNDVRVGPFTDRWFARSLDGDCSAVNLTDTDQTGSVHLHRSRHHVPRLTRLVSTSRPKGPDARRDKMIREGFERPAHEGRTAVRLHPLETIVRLWQPRVQHHRARNRRH